MNKAKPLKFGDTIGVIAPSSPTREKDNVKLSYEKLKQLGFNVKMGKSVYESYGYLAGEDDLRAWDLNNMFLDKEVDGIICLRGGYGTTRILDLLDYDAIKENPKVFVGYSDITALHIAINQICDLVTFHGPMVSSDMIGTFSNFSKDYLFRAIMNNEPMGLIENPEGEKIETFVEGISFGEIVGGNLSLIASAIGTPYEVDTKGKILFIEEIDEEPYRVDRMLTQLKLAGKLNDASGIVLGDWNNCTPKPDDLNSLTLMEVLEDIIKPVGRPTILNLKAGHCEPKVTIPLGVKAKLDATKGELSILESAVE